MNYWDKKREKVNIIKENEKNKFFITYESSSRSKLNIWFVDIGYKNHMIGEINLFQQIDTYLICDVTICDENSVKIKGIGIINVHKKLGTNTLIYDVYFISQLVNNLL